MWGKTVITFIMTVVVIFSIPQTVIGVGTSIPVEVDHLSPELGSFFFSNTTEETILLNHWYEGFKIGTTWNLSVTVHANSTSAVNISMIDWSMNEIWPRGLTGNLSFQVYPNQTRSEIYVSHVSCDYIVSYNFKCSLAEVSESASGSFSFQIVHHGYVASHGTGCVSVGNISAWLEQPTTEPSITTRSSTSSSSRTMFSSSPLTISDSESGITPFEFPFIIFSLIVIIVFVRRRRNLT